MIKIKAFDNHGKLSNVLVNLWKLHSIDHENIFDIRSWQDNHESKKYVYTIIQNKVMGRKMNYRRLIEALNISLVTQKQLFPWTLSNGVEWRLSFPLQDCIFIFQDDEELNYFWHQMMKDCPELFV